jgi:DNA-binding IclR family transcriptional regulator
VDGGDHTIYIGEVLRCSRSKRRPLVFGGGQYLLAQPHAAALPAASVIASGARQRHTVRLCTPWMLRVAEDLDVTICAAVWGNLGPTVVGWESGATTALPGFPLGLVLPVTASAAGKALAATLPPDITGPFVERELGDGSEAVVRWQETLIEIRATGVATHPPTRFWNAELQISAASVAVRDQGGRAIVAMTAVVDSSLDPGVLAEACRRMQEAAATIERQLGYTGETAAGLASLAG